MLLTNQRFLKLAVDLKAVFDSTISDQSLFLLPPFDAAFLKINSKSKLLKDLDIADLKIKVNDFPLNHQFFVAAEKV